MTAIIRTNRTHLTDGSVAWDVSIDAGFNNRFHVDAITEKDALALVDKLQAAIEAHTNEEVEIDEFEPIDF